MSAVAMDTNSWAAMQQACYEQSKKSGFWEDDKTTITLTNEQWTDVINNDGGNDEKVSATLHTVADLLVTPDYSFIPEKIALIHSEISEALEEYRKDGDPKHMYSAENGKPEGFAVELADAVIRIMDLCGALEIDLASVIKRKHEYNGTRAFKHGKIC